MGARHSDAATIAEWKDDLNEAWADLLELIDTRTQMLAASRELHKFFHDCKDVLSSIVEKENTLSNRQTAVIVLLRFIHSASPDDKNNLFL